MSLCQLGNGAHTWDPERREGEFYGRPPSLLTAGQGVSCKRAAFPGLVAKLIVVEAPVGIIVVGESVGFTRTLHHGHATLWTVE